MLDSANQESVFLLLKRRLVIFQGLLKYLVSLDFCLKNVSRSLMVFWRVHSLCFSCQQGFFLLALVAERSREYPKGLKGQS